MHGLDSLRLLDLLQTFDASCGEVQAAFLRERHPKCETCGHWANSAYLDDPGWGRCKEHAGFWYAFSYCSDHTAIHKDAE